MSWRNLLLIVGRLIIAFKLERDKKKIADQVKQREQRYDDIKQNAKNSHAHRFGDSAGSVQLNTKSDHSEPD
ncbi:hypothetical protein P0F15_000509 [Vibrio metschnikovii]|uniref:Uncharacterized protein n=1 Tax=bacterium 19PA01SH03 TaxID=2920705 RepID=A0AAU6SR55_UNCXX|nr:MULTISPECIES: hypothetical protein [unclassified Vibrio]EKO3578645.1 hypothetical protein [Vibrio metschnikovii]EKO3650580.1 hypothetical protein [Vibrio metschnikovii]EKO3662176.1 hypothetical protein [Vibrio metschnikovii]EKO3679189.1 hypothetical protein [Vibrio metschnikovii]EKO3731115.1 hypothetical protein [Vibrio metschnikovii]